MRTLNLGILAHVDAGKTSLTERLLHLVGVTTALGSVDAGTTHTDSLDLERQRGITIKAAVVSFVIGDVTVNLIDTPGHPDFIAEVERTLGILDGAVLVISAVEGIQPQTRVLMRTLQRLRIPTVLFVNKIDRVGAQEETLVRSIADRLTPSLVLMGSTRHRGSRAAEFVPFAPEDWDLTALADHDERVLSVLVGDSEPGPGWRREVLAAQTKAASVCPVHFGSAITGAGVECLTDAITSLLPPDQVDDDGPVDGLVFKIERGAAGERVAFVRLFRGTVCIRDRFGDQTVTAIEVFAGGTTATRSCARAGEIAKVWGLAGVRIGDRLGEGPDHERRVEHHFAAPTLETVVVPRPADRLTLHTALTQLAEQDPLIAFRHDELRQELHLSLYGEVQKEVIQSTLATEFGLEVDFRETTPICIERVIGTGTAVEVMPRRRSSHQPFLAGVGLRIEPGAVGSGLVFDPESQLGALPASFMKAVSETVPEALGQGLFGWQVTDCIVRFTHSQYAPRQSHAHQGFSKAMSSIGSDFRLLTPLVLMEALRRAGTVVCEPIHRYDLEIPTDVLAVMIPTLARLGAPPDDQVVRGSALALGGRIRAAAVHALQQQIPDLTRGEGVLQTVFDGYQPALRPVPTRPRLDHNPLHREEYLLQVLGAVSYG